MRCEYVSGVLNLLVFNLYVFTYIICLVEFAIVYQTSYLKKFIWLPVVFSGCKIHFTKQRTLNFPVSEFQPANFSRLSQSVFSQLFVFTSTRWSSFLCASICTVSEYYSSLNLQTVMYLLAEVNYFSRYSECINKIKKQARLHNVCYVIHCIRPMCSA